MLDAQDSAGAALPASKFRTGPASPRRSVCAPETMVHYDGPLHCIATAFGRKAAQTELKE
jgi:hypothetical protein